MTLSISENIRKQRTSKMLTQEQLAETVGVSPQAVSRWEKGSSYPDITLLPVLADIFGITVDALLGADNIKRRKQVEKILEHNRSLHNEGKIEESLNFVRSKIKEFPDSADLTYQLAYSLDKMLCFYPAKTDSTDVNREILDLCVRAIQLDKASSWVTPASRRMLCLCNIRLGNKDKALEIAQNMPTWWVSREFLSLYALEPDEAAKQRQHNLLSLMDMMILHLHKIARDMKSDEESIIILDKAIQLAEMISGSDHKFYNERVFKCYVWKARYQCRLDDSDNALESLEKAFLCADKYESRPDHSRYEVFWLWRIEDRRTDELKDQHRTLYESLIKEMDKEIYDKLRTKSKFKQLKNTLNRIMSD